MLDEFIDRRIPAVFLSHGAPPLADDPVWTRELAEWSASLRRPSSILVISAHWEEEPLTLGATAPVPLYYDFWGFPQKYYEVTYSAPGAPQLATEVHRLLSDAGYRSFDDPSRGLDHGAYVPLVEMYPDADIPVLQVSMPTLDPKKLFEIGRRLAPLRDQGVLILGSGFATHNLREVRMDRPAYEDPPAWSEEFDDWLGQQIAANDVDALLDFAVRAPAAGVAHPRTEHFAPLFVALGAAADGGDSGQTVVDGFWFGLSKRSLQFG
jgi:4,5-DOPA dioxygenase extradiol